MADELDYETAARRLISVENTSGKPVVDLPYTETNSALVQVLAAQALATLALLQEVKKLVKERAPQPVRVESSASAGSSPQVKRGPSSSFPFPGQGYTKDCGR